MQNKVYYIREVEKVNEGGTSRDIAFFNYMKDKNNVQIKYLKTNISSLKKLKQSFRMIIDLLSQNNKEIILHLSSLTIIFPNKIFSKLFLDKVIHKILERISQNNKLILEINDLLYEQALDLELYNEKIQKKILKIQKKILNIKNADYIFASEEMRRYSIEKYKIDESNTYTCINGSIPLVNKNIVKETKNENKIKCVYAGTLNEGRQIKELINIFEEKLKNCKLILIGINGEWILEKTYKNIEYIGSYTEERALEIVASCDIGLVPYDSSRFYYNLCYPTKNSFYISAGVPLLITPLKESLNQLEKYNILFIEKLENWHKILNKITKEEIQKKKENVEKIKKNFLWNELINRNLRGLKE